MLQHILKILSENDNNLKTIQEKYGLKPEPPKVQKPAVRHRRLFRPLLVSPFVYPIGNLPVEQSRRCSCDDEGGHGSMF